VALANTRSPADSAFSNLRAIIAEDSLFRYDSDLLSEADTRAKLIDPLFKRVLGWHEAEIRREQPVAKGFVDYVLGSNYAHLLIEAKRSKPRFVLNAPTRPRRLQLSGPHLLGNKKVRLVIEQAQGYASDLGVQFCAVSNGSQLIIFRPYLPGRPWRQGTAVVYHDHRDLEQNFAEFFQQLSRDRVIAGSLLEAFDEIEHTTAQHYTVLEHLPDQDRDLIRNRIWQQIAKTMSPLLTDQNENPQGQLEVIANCYVATPLADQTDKSLDSLLRDIPQAFLTEAKVIDLRPGARGRTAFSHKLEADVQQARPGAYLLTGGVGSGKTTFLKRFANIVDRDFVENYCLWIHIDFLPIGHVDHGQVATELRRYVYARMRGLLETQHGSTLSSSGELLRDLFADEIKTLERTTLYGIPSESVEWKKTVNSLVADSYRSDETYTTAALRALRKTGRRVVIVLDNTDQLGEDFQENVFLFSQRLSADFGALCIVVLREEKFFAAYRRGIFDAFGDRRFHIGSPDLRQVLTRRLEYGRKKFASLRGPDAPPLEDQARIDGLLRTVIRSTTRQNTNIVRMLASVSNGDMRLALDMFRDFLSSGNTNVDKILDIVGKKGGYVVPFHEFAKSAILGSRKYYRSGVSRIVNLFKQSDGLAASHLTACRILARLSAAEGAPSPHGEGFVAVSTLLREYRSSFGIADDFVQWGGELLRRSLIEAEPPRVPDIQKADAVRITAAGAYYWRYLVRAFAYVDLVYVDTPLADHALVRHLEGMTDIADMSVRFERVRLFLDYLSRREGEELARVAERQGPFLEPLVKGIRGQIESEIKLIAGKLGIDGSDA
jgi:hypothetical protein